MPEDLRIRVGAEVATITLTGTPAQIAAYLRRYARSLGISVDGTPTENLVAILNHWRNEVIQVSKRVQTKELEDANKAAIAVTVEADNPTLPP